jgi:hypothetical protein
MSPLRAWVRRPNAARNFLIDLASDAAQQVANGVASLRHVLWENDF